MGTALEVDGEQWGWLYGEQWGVLLQKQRVQVPKGCSELLGFAVLVVRMGWLVHASVFLPS